jgi:hypothetical protein
MPDVNNKSKAEWCSSGERESSALDDVSCGRGRGIKERKEEEKEK